ncbi:MAG: hypothetical protein U0X76_02025 [Bacteroidia bacterium]
MYHDQDQFINNDRRKSIFPFAGGEQIGFTDNYKWMTNQEPSATSTKKVKLKQAQKTNAASLTGLISV